jgi:molybdenum cofactor biosynthesis enzyme MoaA
MLLSVGSNGNLRPCCNAINASIKESPGVTAYISNKKDYTVDSLLNNHTHKELRETMLEGERHSMCDRCWKMEDSGMKSFREMINDRFSDVVSKVRETRDSAPVGIRRIEFDLGRKCNLRCRMCAPWSSTLISKEISSNPESAEYYGGFTEVEDWVDVVDIQELIKPHLDTVDEIYLIGGEPLIIDAHEELLDYLVETGACSHISLIYNTNGITLRPKFISHWKQFRSVQLNVSVDGIYEYYDYIRNPAKWQTIEDNIGKLLEQTSDSNNITCGISSTLQNLTVPSILSLLRWADSKGIHVHVHTVEYPEFLQPDVMPEMAYQFYLEEMKNNVDTLGINSYSLREVISYLENNKKNLQNYDMQKKFVYKQRLLDKIRNQDLFETHGWASEI